MSEFFITLTIVLIIHATFITLKRLGKHNVLASFHHVSNDFESVYSIETPYDFSRLNFFNNASSTCFGTNSEISASYCATSFTILELMKE